MGQLHAQTCVVAGGLKALFGGSETSLIVLGCSSFGAHLHFAENGLRAKGPSAAAAELPTFGKPKQQIFKLLPQPHLWISMLHFYRSRPSLMYVYILHCENCHLVLMFTVLMQVLGSRCRVNLLLRVLDGKSYWHCYLWVGVRVPYCFIFYIYFTSYSF